jgi:hypothetical protein
MDQQTCDAPPCGERARAVVQLVIDGEPATARVCALHLRELLARARSEPEEGIRVVSVLPLSRDAGHRTGRQSG